jgi:integrase
MALKSKEVENAKPAFSGSKQKLIPKLYADGNGLFLRAAPAANGAITKSWVYRFQINGKRNDMGLGALADLTLANARIKALELRQMVVAKIDPLAARNAQQGAQMATKQEAELATAQQTTNFAEVAATYIEAKAAGWTNPKHASQWQATLATYGRPFASKPVAEVTVDDVEAALRPIWNVKTETATRVLDRILKVLTYAHDKELRNDVDGWSAKLYRSLPDLPKKETRVEHHPALPYERIAAFIVDLRSRASTGGKALEFAILCASRSGEIRLARWSEINFESASWMIPASRMKMKKTHRVPLSDQAIALLKSIPQGEANDLIFPGKKQGKPLSDMTLTAAIRRRNEKTLTWIDESGEAITVHGFRSTFKDWASEETPYPNVLSESALAHQVKEKTEAAYRRGDLFEKRRDLMQDWADYCTKLVINASVTPVRGKEKAVKSSV